MLLKVDGETGELAATVQLGTGGLHDAAAGPGGIWAADCTGNTVYLVSTETTEVVASIVVEGCPSEIAAFAGTVLVLAQHRQAIVQIDSFGFRVVAEYYGDPYGPPGRYRGGGQHL